MIKKKTRKCKNQKKDSGTKTGEFVDLKKFYHLYSSPA